MSPVCWLMISSRVSLGSGLKALGQVTDPQVRVTAHMPAAGWLNARQDAHQGGLAAAIRTHQPDALAWVQAEGYVFKKDL